VLPVIRFLEKPSYETAHKFVESGRYLWNSGMFIFRAGVLLDAMAEHMPRLRQGLERIEQALGTPREAEVMQAEYPHFEKTSIDYGIMEKLDNLACVSPGFTWDDVGSWGSLARHVEADGQGNVVQGKTVLIDAAENLVAGDDESLIAAVGVSGLIVVKEGNRVLICRRDQDQRVKELLKEIDGDPKLRRFL
jgi:mannose-1-phosphate guanylyltransferase